MKNNPLNGYQPDDELVAVADAQEHEIEHVQKPAANAAQSPETDAATVDPDTGEIIDTTDGAAAHDDDTDAAERPIHYPTCRFCGKQNNPRRAVQIRRGRGRGGNPQMRLFRRATVSRRSRT